MTVFNAIDNAAEDLWPAVIFIDVNLSTWGIVLQNKYVQKSAVPKNNFEFLLRHHSLWQTDKEFMSYIGCQRYCPWSANMFHVFTQMY